MTPDLDKLKNAARKLAPLFDDIELRLVDDPAWRTPSDHSYLSAAERKNPDIAANVAAMDATNELISWFGEDMEGYVGLWRGPKNHPLDKAPIVRLDSEGQYDIVSFTIADWLVITSNDFDDARRQLVANGFRPAKSEDAIWEQFDHADKSDDPNEYRNALYVANLKAAKKPAAKKAAAKKPAAKKPAPKKQAAKKPAPKKQAASKKR